MFFSAKELEEVKGSGLAEVDEIKRQFVILAQENRHHHEENQRLEDEKEELSGR